MKRVLIITGLLLIGIVNLLMYGNIHLFHHARDDVGSLKEKIRILEKANHLCPLNDEVYRELGWAHFQLADQNLDDSQVRELNFRESTADFVRSIRLNPGSYKTHFLFGQSLMYMNYFESRDVDYFSEFRKAAVLDYSDRDVYFTIGLIFLSHWEEMGEEIRKYAVRMLQDASHYKQPDRYEQILQTWASIGGSYELMDQILPKDPDVYRRYADFLGEKSMSLEERQKKLAQAEFMEYSEAQQEYNLGKNDFRVYRFKSALDHFSSALDNLNRLSFYQKFTTDKPIDQLKFNNLKKSLYWELIQSWIPLKGSFDKIKELIRHYVKLETEPARFAELENYLNRKKIIGIDGLSVGPDLNRLFCVITLDFAQNRFRDVVSAGGELDRIAALASSAESKNDLIELYRLIGDAERKLDYLYDSNAFYQKVLDLDPEDLKTLTRMVKNYQRLNDAGNVQKYMQLVEQSITPEETVFDDLIIKKGQPFDRTIRLAGNKIKMIVDIQSLNPEIDPLISLFLNGRVVWENFLGQGPLVLSLVPEIGGNTFRVISVNGPVKLNKIGYMEEKDVE